MKYLRLVELYVKPDLRDEIKILKGGQTSDEFLRDLIFEREKKDFHKSRKLPFAKVRRNPRKRFAS